MILDYSTVKRGLYVSTIKFYLEKSMEVEMLSIQVALNYVLLLVLIRHKLQVRYFQPTKIAMSIVL